MINIKKTVNKPKIEKSQINLLAQSKLLQLLSSYVTIKDIAKELNLKPNSIYVSFKRYLKKGWINQDRTLTNEGILKCQQGHALLKKVNSITPDTIRANNLVFTISTKHLKNWNKRQQFLQVKDIKFKKVGYNWSGESIIINNVKVWLTPLSVVIYMPNYYGEDANSTYRQALDDLFFNYIPKIERLLETSLKSTEGYKIRISRQHYGLVKNALAMQYHDEKKKLFCRDENGLWLLIDNSLNLKELELVHSKTALDDTPKVLDFFNDLKKNPTTPSEILNLINKQAEILNQTAIIQQQETQKMGFYAKHIETHTQAIIDLDKGIKKLNELLEKIANK